MARETTNFLSGAQCSSFSSRPQRCCLCLRLLFKTSSLAENRATARTSPQLVQLDNERNVVPANTFLEVKLCLDECLSTVYEEGQLAILDVKKAGSSHKTLSWSKIQIEE